MSKLSLWKTIGLVCVFCAAAVIDSPAQTLTTLASFNGSNGADPQASLVQGLDGNFYGTTFAGGANDDGTVFKITPGGTLTTLYNFCSKTGCTDGSGPQAGLVLATDGNFYGTTELGGASTACPSGCGTVFKVTPDGTLTTLHSFDGSDGEDPVAALIQATDGNFYGTTDLGGPNWYNTGTVFKITPAGALTTLHSFDFYDGEAPLAALVQATDGNFYGTTSNGGEAYGFGTVFKITAGGTLTTLHSFCSQSNSQMNCSDGANPFAGLVLGTDGNLYGTTKFGGAVFFWVCASEGCGTVFKITPDGALTTLHSFDLDDGAYSIAGLVQATDGNFYGTMDDGGPETIDGTVFKITPGGTLTTLHSFDFTDGANPLAALVQATDGNFYGTTCCGGASYPNLGTVFSLAVGLGPFVETLPTFGDVGATVMILGTDLTGATCVMFNGKAATFKVVSSTEITTTVPTGAATGKVEVTTPKGTLISNVNFRVTPSVISVTPAAATGTDVTFALAYSASPGEAYTDLEWARVLFKGQTGVNVCRVDYYQPCEEFYLESDTGTWLGPLTAGSGQTLSNSQCTLNGRGTTVAGSGSTLTLNLSLTAASGFVGEKNIDMWVSDMQGYNSGWQTEGTWTPAPATAPAATRRSPSR
jgi:uncharacterized repeat protein (TIGR03803 family)